MRRLRVTIVALVLAVQAAPSAAADKKQTPEQRALAEALFQAGRKLMSENRVTEACAKFTESQRVAPAGGTLLNLAICHETEGMLATALIEFQESVAVARKSGRKDRLDIAQRHLETLEAVVPSLKINVPAASQHPGLIVRRDGVRVQSEAWGLDVPVNPGVQAITVEAPGFTSWQDTVSVGPGEHLTLDVPVLSRTEPDARLNLTSVEPSSLETLPSPDRSDRDLGSLRTSAWVAGAVGIGLATGGAYYGMQALSKRRDSDEECVGGCTERGVALNVEAQRAATRCNVLAGGGVILTGLAAFVLLHTAPSPANETVARESRWQLGGGLSQRGVDVVATGVF